ncbi:hypothetical protein FACS1894137_06820 [Spirochaetia bacterium]|nr:hypothetical protein FACS1894137_06820 [Spirochaetia bacterium]
MIPAKPLAILLCAALISLCTHTVYAQSAGADVSASGKAAKPEKTEFPQWARDLRRADIIAFGSFPFTMFTAIFFMDTYRAANHNWSAAYRPWPFKGAGAVAMTKNERTITLSAAIAGSVVIALTDHLIVRVKRAKAKRQLQDMPEGDPIIIRKPWPPGEDVEEEDTDSP